MNRQRHPVAPLAAHRSPLAARHPLLQPEPDMQQANYVNDIVCRCAPENRFAQDAIEWAVVSGFVELFYNDMNRDERQVMERYDAIIVAYRRVVAHLQDYVYSHSVAGGHASSHAAVAEHLSDCEVAHA